MLFSPDPWIVLALQSTIRYASKIDIYFSRMED